MRKAVWGALLLGVFALSTVSPIREVQVLHQVLGLGLLGGYLLLSMDPPEPTRRQRQLFIAGILCSVASFLLVILLGASVTPLGRALSVAAIALPVWLAAGPLRAGFIAAGVLALVTFVPALEGAGGYATSTHGYVAALSVWAVALLLHRPDLLPAAAGGKRDRKPPRVVVARDVVFLTPEEKAERLARLEKRFQAGEIPEHKYWDLRQEIESR